MSKRVDSVSNGLHMTFPTRLGELLTRMVPTNPDIYDELRGLYDPNVAFRDPIQVQNGIEDFIAANQRLIGRMRELEWQIHSAFGDEETALIEWTMRGTPKLGPSVCVDGVTRARARGGKIYDHRDYFDFDELLTSALPAGSRILRMVRRPFA